MSGGAKKALAILRRGPASTYVLARAGLGDVKAAIGLLGAGYDLGSYQLGGSFTGFAFVAGLQDDAGDAVVPEVRDS